MSVTVTGINEFQRKMLSLGPDMVNAVDQGVEVTAGDIRTFAIRSIQEQSPGQMVRRSRQGGGTYNHVAAASGNAPNSDTGRLVTSISAERIGEAEYVVGTNLPYGSHLEFGTKKSNGKSWPWLHPAMMANTDGLIVNIHKVVNIYIGRLK